MIQRAPNRNPWQQYATLYDPDAEVTPELPKSTGTILPMMMGQNRYKKYRLKLLKRNPVCFYCRKSVSADSSSLDHLIPESRGGQFVPGNLQLCCQDCNRSKGDATPVEWLAELEAKIAGLRATAEAVRERIAAESLQDFVAPQQRSTGKKGKGGRPSVEPPDWYIDRKRFSSGKSEFMITSRETGRSLIRGLKLQDAVHFFLTVGADDSLGLTEATPLSHDGLGLKPRPPRDSEEVES